MMPGETRFLARMVPPEVRRSRVLHKIQKHRGSGNPNQLDLAQRGFRHCDLYGIYIQSCCTKLGTPTEIGPRGQNQMRTCKFLRSQGCSYLTRAYTIDIYPEERLKPELTFNPALQYFGQVVTHRIANPPEVAGTELPPLNQAVADYVRPDKELFEEAKDEVSAFEEAFPLQPVNDDENRKRQRVYWRDLIQRERN